MEELTKKQGFHKPDWHPDISGLLGDLRGAFGYITPVGTVSLLGPNPQETLNIPEDSVKTEIQGPLLCLSAKGGLF